MKVKEIRDLIDYIKSTGLEEVNIETETFKIKIKRSSEVISQPHFSPPTALPQSLPKQSLEAVGDGSKISSKIVEDDKYITINSQKKSLYAKKNIKKNETFKKSNITIKGPAGGLLPKYMSIIINKKAKTKVLKDEPITWDLL